MPKDKEVHIIDIKSQDPLQYYIDPQIEGSYSSLNSEERVSDIDSYHEQLGLKYKESFGKIKYIMIDIAGTLYDEIKVKQTHKAAHAIARLKSGGFQLQFVINSIKGMPIDLCECLKDLGLDLQPSEIFTSIAATVMYLKKNNLRPYLMVDPSVLPYFKGMDKKDPNVVIVGLYSTQLNYSLMAKGLRLLVNGTPLLSFNLAAKEYTGVGIQRLGPGPFLQCLQYLTQTEQIDLAKPSPLFFENAFEKSGFNPEECVMIGDDICEDITGAGKYGVRGILVKTGDYRLDDEKKAIVPVAAVAKNLFEAALILLCASAADRGEVYSVALSSSTGTEDETILDDQDETLVHNEVDINKYSFLNEVCGYYNDRAKCKVITDSQVW